MQSIVDKLWSRTRYKDKDGYSGMIESGVHNKLKLHGGVCIEPGGDAHRWSVRCAAERGAPLLIMNLSMTAPSRLPLVRIQHLELFSIQSTHIIPTRVWGESLRYTSAPVRASLGRATSRG